MIGFINKITAQTGQRDEVMRLILQGSSNMAGCHSYIVAADAEKPDDIWITEVWEDAEAHQASLKNPAVRQSIEQAMPMIAGFESVATTVPSSGARSG
ncbi:MAG: antibiotic biosynthesis monooxygenase [Natronospirillum sp.]